MLKNIPQNKRKYLLETVMDKADSRRMYAWAIRQFKQAQTLYPFDSLLHYQLALLYDHRAMQLKKKNKRKSRELFSLAQGIYETILKKEPRHVMALHGLARVEGETKKYPQAIKHHLLAYAYMHKRPKKHRGALGIGNTFLLAGRSKEAEKWFLREYEDLGKKDLGALANVVIFYASRKEYKKGLPYAKELERRLKKEKRYIEYMKMGKDKTIEFLIGNIKKMRMKAISRKDSFHRAR